MKRERWGQHAHVEHPGQATPFAVKLLTRVALPVLRVLHRPTLVGTEHLPARGRYLLVGNHPTSLGVSEFGSFAALWAERFGDSRPLAAFAHAFGFDVWPMPWVFRQIGAVPSTYGAAERTLAADIPVLVLPGGDHEAFRPFTRTNEVDFNGRLGFLRIAHRTWSPIVPMAFRGSAAPFLHRSRLLAYVFVWPRLTGIKRYGLSVSAALGATGILAFAPLPLPWRAALAYLYAASPLALLPILPATVRIAIGEPMSPESLFGHPPTQNAEPADEAVLRAALAKVESAVQALLDAP